MAQADAVPVGHAVGHQRGDGVQGVEPAPGLVDGLADVVRGKVRLERLVVLEGVVPLGIGHRAGIEPAVDHLRHAVPGPAVLLECDPVDARAVQVDIRHGFAAQFLEFRQGADAVVVALAVRPHRQRRAPETLPRQRPVDVVLEPVAEPPLPDGFGDPVDGAVEGHHPVPDLRGADIPGLLGVVDQRVAGAPAERVVVPGLLVQEHETPLLQQGTDHRVRILEEQAGHRAGLRPEAAVEADPVHHRQALALPQGKVVHAVGGGGMNDAGAVLRADEVRRHHAERVAAGHVEKVEQPLVAGAHQVPALHRLRHAAVRIAEQGFQPGGRDDQRLVPGFHERVVDVFPDRQKQVGRQRPGRGGPHQEAGVGQAGQAEAHRDGGILHLLVAQRHLVGGQRGADAWVVGHHLVALVDESLVPDLPEQVPGRLDVPVVEGVVGLLEVDPVSHAPGHGLPLADVGHHGFAALAGEFGDAHLPFDFLLVEDPEFLLDLVLHRQAMGVPSPLAGGVVPAHGLVAGVDILERPRQDMVDARPAVRGGGALVETEPWPALALLEGFLEDRFAVPEFEDLCLQCGPVVAAADFAECHDL